MDGEKKKKRKKSRQAQWHFKGYPHHTRATNGSISCPLLILVSEDLSLNSHKKIRTVFAQWCQRCQRTTGRWRCAKMNSKWVLRKGQYRLSQNIFARKEHQLSTPPVLKSDTTCSQFKLLPGYLIKTHLGHCCIAWSSSSPTVHSSHSFMANEIINNGHCTLSFLSAQRKKFYSRPGTLHTPQVIRSLL